MQKQELTLFLNELFDKCNNSILDRVDVGNI